MGWCGRAVGAVAGVVLAGGSAAAGSAGAARLPVKEVTVFKDGHAFVLHAGRVPTGGGGDVVLDELPSPVLGTFWPYVSDRRARLVAVTAGRSEVREERTALDLRQLVEANPGASVVVTEVEGPTYEAKIVGVPSERPRADVSVASASAPAPTARVVLLETEGGTKVIGLDRIRDVRFTGAYRRTVEEDAARERLTLRLRWDGAPQRDAEVGFAYLQKGLRWIPSYRVEIDGAGRAVVKLQATLVNDLADLEDVTTHLVIGVPSFAFADTPDPVGLERAAAELSRGFQNDGRTPYALSNAIMTQQLASVRIERPEPAAAGTGALDDAVAGAGAHEDLYVFTLEHVTLRKGERAVVPVGEFSMAYRDVFALDLPAAPPPEMWRNLESARPDERTRVLGLPRLTHRIRLTNGSSVPLTTAPATILRGGRLLAQGLMTYAAPGADSEVTVTTVSDVSVRKRDEETARVPDAATWQREAYARVDLAGSLTLVSHRAAPVEVEVTRHVLGNVQTADHGGRKEMVNVLEDAGAAPSLPDWWGRISWPWWWARFNGVGRVRWTVTLQPGQPLTLGYTWNYFWR